MEPFGSVSGIYGGTVWEQCQIGVYGVLLFGYTMPMGTQADFLKTLADILNRRCLEKGYSYRGLAEKTDLAHTSVRRYLRAERDIPSTSFEQIARALGLTPWKVYKQAEDELLAKRLEAELNQQPPAPPVPDEDGNYHMGHANLPDTVDLYTLAANTNTEDIELEQHNETDYA